MQLYVIIWNYMLRVCVCVPVRVCVCVCMRIFPLRPLCVYMYICKLYMMYEVWCIIYDIWYQMIQHKWRAFFWSQRSGFVKVPKVPCTWGLQEFGRHSQACILSIMEQKLNTVFSFPLGKKPEPEVQARIGAVQPCSTCFGSEKGFISVTQWRLAMQHIGQRE